MPSIFDDFDKEFGFVTTKEEPTKEGLFSELDKEFGFEAAPMPEPIPRPQFEPGSFKEKYPPAPFQPKEIFPKDFKEADVPLTDLWDRVKKQTDPMKIAESLYKIESSDEREKAIGFFPEDQRKSIRENIKLFERKHSLVGLGAKYTGAGIAEASKLYQEDPYQSKSWQLELDKTPDKLKELADLHRDNKGKINVESAAPEYQGFLKHVKTKEERPEKYAGKVKERGEKIEKVAEHIKDFGEYLDPVEIKEYKIAERIDALKKNNPAYGAALERGDLKMAIERAIGQYTFSGDEEKANKFIELNEKYDEATAMKPDEKRGFIKNILVSTLEMLPPMAKTAAKGLVPYVGQAWAMSEWAEQGTGMVMNDLRKAGVSFKTGRKIAPLVGLAYAAVENVQVGQVFKLAGNITASNLKKSIVQTALKILREKGEDWLQEVGEEGVQQFITDVGTDIGKKVEGLSDKNFGQIMWNGVKGGVKASVQSMGPMGILSFGGSAVSMAKTATEEIVGKPETAVVKPPEPKTEELYKPPEKKEVPAPAAAPVTEEEKLFAEMDKELGIAPSPAAPVVELKPQPAETKPAIIETPEAKSETVLEKPVVEPEKPVVEKPVKPEAPFSEKQWMFNVKGRGADRTTLEMKAQKLIDKDVQQGKPPRAMETALDDVYDMAKNDVTDVESIAHFNSDVDKIYAPEPFETESIKHYHLHGDELAFMGAWTDPETGKQQSIIAKADIPNFGSFNDTKMTGHEWTNDLNRKFQRNIHDYIMESPSWKTAKTNAEKVTAFSDALKTLKRRIAKIEVELPNGKTVNLGLNIGMGLNPQKAEGALNDIGEKIGRNSIAIDNDLKKEYNINDIEGIDLTEQYYNAGLRSTKLEARYEQQKQKQGILPVQGKEKREPVRPAETGGERRTEEKRSPGGIAEAGARIEPALPAEKEKPAEQAPVKKPADFGYPATILTEPFLRSHKYKEPSFTEEFKALSPEEKFKRLTEEKRLIRKQIEKMRAENVAVGYSQLDLLERALTKQQKKYSKARETAARRQGQQLAAYAETGKAKTVLTKQVQDDIEEFLKRYRTTKIAALNKFLKGKYSEKTLQKAVDAVLKGHKDGKAAVDIRGEIGGYFAEGVSPEVVEEHEEAMAKKYEEEGVPEFGEEEEEPIPFSKGEKPVKFSEETGDVFEGVLPKERTPQQIEIEARQKARKGGRADVEALPLFEGGEGIVGGTEQLALFNKGEPVEFKKSLVELKNLISPALWDSFDVVISDKFGPGNKYSFGDTAEGRPITNGAIWKDARGFHVVINPLIKENANNDAEYLYKTFESNKKLNKYEKYSSFIIKTAQRLYEKGIKRGKTRQAIIGDLTKMLYGAQLSRLLVHEIMGHAGAINTLRQNKKVYKRISDLYRVAKYTDKMEKLREKYAEELAENPKFAEDIIFGEWIAYSMEDYIANPNRRGIGYQVWRAIRQFLIDMGLAEDTVEDVMYAIAKDIKNLKSVETKLTMKPMMQKGERESLTNKAKRYFGVTDDLRFGGYILENGRMLDLSGRKQGNTYATGRALDHREISYVDDNMKGGTAGMQEFMSGGNIRMDFNSGSLDIYKSPSPEQMKTIQRFVSQSKSNNLRIEMQDGLGSINDKNDYYTRKPDAFSKDYPAKTPASVILKDIQNYYAGGLRKEQTLAQQYHEGDADVLYQKSLKEISPTFYSPLQKAVSVLKQEKGTGDQMFAMITKTPGVKEAEWKWMGLDDFLKGKQSVTKAEIEEFVRQNKVEIKEVEKGKEPFKSPLSEEESARLEELSQATDLSIEEEAEYKRISKKFKNAKDVWVATSIPKTKFSQYTLPGGSNYREVLLTLPAEKAKPLDYDIWRTENAAHLDDESAKFRYNQLMERYKNEPAYGAKADKVFKSSHWDEPNVIAHVRMNDRTGPNGEKVLFVEEIQSDWAREAREKGIRGTGDEILPLENIQSRPDGKFRVFSESERGFTDKIVDTHEEAVQWLRDRINENAGYTQKGVPAQPFLKNWEELTLKRVLRMAAEEGYDRVAWINGEQTADRYDLSKQIESVKAHRANSFDEDVAQYELNIDTKGGQNINDVYSEKELADTIGKDLATKIINDITEDNPSQTYSGIDLKIGGEWAVNLYDRIIPKFFEKYGKKWNVKVELVNLGEKLEDQGDVVLNDTGPQQSIPITQAMRDAVLYEGQPMFQKGEAAAEPDIPELQDINEFIKEQKGEKVKEEEVMETALSRAKTAARKARGLESMMSDMRIKLGNMPENLIQKRVELQYDLEKMKAKHLEIVRDSVYDYLHSLTIKGMPLKNEVSINSVLKIAQEAKSSGDLIRAVDAADELWNAARKRDAVEKLKDLVERKYRKLKKIGIGTAPATADLEHNNELKKYLDDLINVEPGKQERVDRVLTWLQRDAQKEMKGKSIVELPESIQLWAEDPTQPIPGILHDELQNLFKSRIEFMSMEQINKTILDIQSIEKTGRTVRQNKEKERLLNEQLISAGVAREIIKKKTEKTVAEKAVLEEAYTKSRKEKRSFSKKAKALIWNARDIDRIVIALTGKLRGTALEENFVKPLARAYSDWKRGMKGVDEFIKNNYADMDMKKVRTEKFMDIEMDVFDKDKGRADRKSIPITLENAMLIYGHSKDRFPHGAQREHLIATISAQDREYANSVIDKVVKALPEEYKKAVENQWKYYAENQWGRMNRVFGELRNINMDKVDHYIPLNNLDNRFTNEGLEADLMARAVYQANVRFGATKTRIVGENDINTTMAAPLRHLRYFDVIIPNMKEAEHYIAFGLPIRDTNRLLKSDAVKEAMNLHDPAVQPIMRDWLKSLAYGKWNYGQSNNFLNTIIRDLRSRAGSYQILGRVTSLMVQASSFFRGLVKVSKKEALKSMGYFISHGVEAVKTIDEKSANMATRTSEYEQAISEFLETIDGKKLVGSFNMIDNAKEKMAALIGWHDKIWAGILWHAKYSESINRGMNEDNAIYEADKLVRTTQSGGGLFAANAFQRGTEVERAFTQYLSDSIKAFNMLDELVNGWKDLSVRDRAMYVAFGMILPALVTHIIRGGFEPLRNWEEFLRELFLQNTAAIPLVGQIMEALVFAAAAFSRKKRGIKQQYKDMPEFMGKMDAPAFSIVGDMSTDLVSVLDFEKWKKSPYKNITSLIDLIFLTQGLPGGAQIKKTLQGTPAFIETKDPRYLYLSKTAVEQGKVDISPDYAKYKDIASDAERKRKIYKELKETNPDRAREYQLKNIEILRLTKLNKKTEEGRTSSTINIQQAEIKEQLDKREKALERGDNEEVGRIDDIITQKSKQYLLYYKRMAGK